MSQYSKKLAKNYSDYYDKNPEMIKNLKKMIITTKWMNKCTFLTTTNKIVHNCEENNCNISFNDKNGNPYIHSIFSEFGEQNGVFVHTECWKFIKNKYGIELKYSDLTINLNPKNKNSYKVIDFIDYGKIEKYWAQDFNFAQVLIDGNENLCDSSSKGNTKNIISTFNKLKIKSDRIGPSCSASFYNNGDVKIGNNKKFWIIKSGKWIEINDSLINFDVRINRKNKYQLSLKFIGEFSKEPVFISKINYDENTFTIITCKSIAEKVKEKLNKKR